MIQAIPRPSRWMLRWLTSETCKAPCSKPRAKSSLCVCLYSCFCSIYSYVMYLYICTWVYFLFAFIVFLLREVRSPSFRELLEPSFTKLSSPPDVMHVEVLTSAMSHRFPCSTWVSEWVESLRRLGTFSPLLSLSPSLSPVVTDNR